MIPEPSAPQNAPDPLEGLTGSFSTTEGNWDFPEDLQGRDERLKDFRLFLFVVWEFLGKTPSKVQYDMARFLQKGGDRLCLFAYRAAGKSWVCSAFALWILYWWPDKKILVVSASSGRANEFTKFTLQLVYGMPLLSHMIPQASQRCSGLAFDIGGVLPDHNPSVKSIGVLGQMAGSHADVIVGDDIEIPKNSDTPMARLKLAERSKEFEAIINIGGKQVILGTPQNEQTVYADFVKRRGFLGWVWPVRFPENAIHPLGQLAPMLAKRLKTEDLSGGSSLFYSTIQTDPERGLSEEELLQFETTYGKSGFALQFMLDTRLSDDLKQPLSLNDLLVVDLPRDAAPPILHWATGKSRQLDIPHLGRDGQFLHSPIPEEMSYQKYTAIGLFVDPSGRGKDETAWAVVACMNGMYYVLDFGGFQGGGYDDAVLHSLAETARVYRVSLVVAEDNFGNGMFTKLLTPILQNTWMCGIEEVRVHTRKELRIIGNLEPIMNQHRLVIDKAALLRDYRKLRDSEGSLGDLWQTYALTYQMSRLTKDRGALPHDDRIEAVSMGVSWWADQALLDVERTAKEKDTKLDDQFREQSLISVFGSKKRPRTAEANRGLSMGSRSAKRWAP